MRFDPKSWGKFDKFAQAQSGVYVVWFEDSPRDSAAYEASSPEDAYQKFMAGEQTLGAFPDAFWETQGGVSMPDGSIVAGPFIDSYKDSYGPSDFDVGHDGKPREPKLAQVDPPHMGPPEGPEALWDLLFGEDDGMLESRVENLAAEHPDKAEQISGVMRHYFDAQHEVNQTFVQNLHDLLSGSPDSGTEMPPVETID
jgi:hypothetical protein